jgi:hypothetical protein
MPLYSLGDALKGAYIIYNLRSVDILCLVAILPPFELGVIKKLLSFLDIPSLIYFQLAGPRCIYREIIEFNKRI